jgi:hypothetical protein
MDQSLSECSTNVLSLLLPGRTDKEIEIELSNLHRKLRVTFRSSLSLVRELKIHDPGNDFNLFGRDRLIHEWRPVVSIRLDFVFEFGDELCQVRIIDYPRRMVSLLRLLFRRRRFPGRRMAAGGFILSTRPRVFATGGRAFVG